MDALRTALERLRQVMRYGLPSLVAVGLGVVAGADVAQAQANLAIHPAALHEGEPITYAKHIAPIIQETCQTCHRPGSVAPMSFLDYESVRSWGPAIKLRTQERSMPPWPLDKTVGIQHFTNDVSLTDEEIALIAAWVDSGAPLGDPADMPPPVEWPDTYSDSWQFEDVYNRPPDLVIRSPAYTVEANGLDQWPDPVTKVTNLDKPRWIRAIEFWPGTPDTRYVFHHANPSMRYDGESTGLIAAAVGKAGEVYPENTGKLIMPGAEVEFGMHFFPIGEEVDAVMELGLWFYPEGEEPKFETPGEVQHRADLSTGSGGYPGHSREIARRGDLVIPPHGTAVYQGTYVLDKPTRIHSLRGHMHLRGKYQIVEAILPTGERQLINKLNWDHGWHTTFLYEDYAMPLLPKGTVLLTTSIFDNTADNHHNPDPDQWVVAGSRTVDEMSHIWIGMTYFDDEAEFQGLVEEQKRKRAELGITDLSATN